MKKLIALTLVLALSLAVLAACDKQSDTAAKPSATTQTTTTSGEADDTPAPEEMNLVVYEDNGVTVTVLNLEESFWGTGVKVKITNETDKNLCLSTDDCIVNGITVGGLGMVEAPAGETVTGEVCAYAVDLESAGIDSIGAISFPNAVLVDSETYELLYAVPFSVTVDADYHQAIHNDGKLLFSGEGIHVYARILKDDPNDEVVYLLIKNETGKKITVEGKDIQVNGIPVEGWLFDVIYPDTVRYSDFMLSLIDLEELGINTLESVAFSLIFADEDYNTLTETQPLTITIE